MIKKLEEKFTGSGEVRGFNFKILRRGKNALWYVISSGEKRHFEVFMVKTTPICLDFENRIYSETETKEIYPKSKDFGIWAWTYTSMAKAIDKFNELEHEI